jgi:hypothetical protein
VKLENKTIQIICLHYRGDIDKVSHRICVTARSGLLKLIHQFVANGAYKSVIKKRKMSHKKVKGPVLREWHQKEKEIFISFLYFEL